MLQRSKGTAGMGSRGKNAPKRQAGTATAKRKRNTGRGKTLSRPSGSARANQKRNQKEWSKKKAMQTRY